jgi:hypothetical protein
MAWSEVTVDVVGNPASGRKKGAMKKRKLSDKQIRIFGTKSQKAGLQRRLSAKRSAKRSAVKRSAAKRPAKKSSHRPRTAAKKQNPAPQLLALTLGNSAKKVVRSMATSKKKKGGGGASAASRQNGGRKKKKMFSRPAHRRNPGQLGSPMEWITGGAGVLTGVVGTRALPQLVLGEKNQGPMGYLANGLTAAGLGWVAHLVFPRNRVLVAGVLAGGFAAVIARVIGDYTTYGKYLSLTGVGDYMVSNAVAPQRLMNPGSAMVEVPTGWGAPPMMAFQSSGAGSDMASSGIDLGRRAGVC